MLKVRCKLCNKELESHPTKAVCCGCDNMTMVRGDTITAVDLNQVLMLNSVKPNKNSGVLTSADLAYQESRRSRKVRKLDFEVR
jgi:hypothetical protein